MAKQKWLSSHFILHRKARIAVTISRDEFTGKKGEARVSKDSNIGKNTVEETNH